MAIYVIDCIPAPSDSATIRYCLGMERYIDLLASRKDAAASAVDAAQAWMSVICD